MVCCYSASHNPIHMTLILTNLKFVFQATISYSIFKFILCYASFIFLRKNLRRIKIRYCSVFRHVFRGAFW